MKASSVERVKSTPNRCDPGLVVPFAPVVEAHAVPRHGEAPEARELSQPRRHPRRLEDERRLPRRRPLVRIEPEVEPVAEAQSRGRRHHDDPITPPQGVDRHGIGASRPATPDASRRVGRTRPRSPGHPPPSPRRLSSTAPRAAARPVSSVRSGGKWRPIAPDAASPTAPHAMPDRGHAEPSALCAAARGPPSTARYSRAIQRRSCGERMPASRARSTMWFRRA